MLVLGAGLAIWSVADAFAAGLNIRTQRLAGPFLIPNTAATLFGMLVALCLGGLVSRASGSRRAQAFERAGPYGGLALLFAACLLATASRGGGLAAGAGLVAFAALLMFAGRLRWSRALLAGAAALVAGAVLLAISGDLILDRAFGTTLADTSRRLIFTPHWEAFAAAPVGGYGLGVFDIVNRTLLDTGNIRELWVVRAAHNVFLTWLEHTGVVGALPMFACVGAVIALSLRGALRRQRMTAILFGLLAADVVIVVHGLSDFALETYSMAAFWSYLLGLQFAASQSAAR
ncbi:O-antigen ligase [Phenylobacterium sp. J367]|uniref:O-antigen ligase family protein n=1 Tax=Phenylobacterium sp. J367 TaxID=2898435 RepID=UPI0021506EA1|nr:O-antigen ligase family protein [Phenylobacterium sp. J367]MCR5879518.1 O-antigen ligase family protein [Phenylobacterium sp. J367]